MFLGFYFVTSTIFTSVPGAGLAWLLRGTLNDETLGFVSARSTCLLFPVVLLSLLENGSPINPLSGEVWRSMWRVARSWLTFYILSVIVVVAQIVGVCLTLLGGGATAVVLGPAIVVIGMMIYYRLLGRLALCCSVSAAAEEPDDEPPEHDDM